MEIAIHLGAHLTDEDRLIRCLMRNRDTLATRGIVVPGTSRYRAELRRLANELSDRPVNAETQEALLDGLISEDRVKRVVFSSDGFMSNHGWAVVQNQFYPRSGEKAHQLRRLFPDAQVEFFLAIRNPATFLPALVADPRSRGLDQVMRGTDPMELRWSETIGRILDATPDCPLTVWCDEDTPLIWPDVLAAVAGIESGLDLAGLYERYRDFVTAEGVSLMARWLAERPTMDAGHRRRVIGAFLDKFAEEEKVEVEAELPGWNQETAEVLSELYARDVDLIASLPGVTFIEA